MVRNSQINSTRKFSSKSKISWMRTEKNWLNYRKSRLKNLIWILKVMWKFSKKTIVRKKPFRKSSSSKNNWCNSRNKISNNYSNNNNRINNLNNNNSKVLLKNKPRIFWTNIWVKINRPKINLPKKVLILIIVNNYNKTSWIRKKRKNLAEIGPKYPKYRKIVP